MADRTRILIVRGQLVTPWELRPWRELPDRFGVSYLITGANEFDPGDLGLTPIEVKSLRQRLPRGPLGEVAAGVLGDRYLGADGAFAQADIVHAEELSFWFAADAARHKAAGGRFKLVQTVWETIPFLETYRNRRARLSRGPVLAHTDLFLAATERAREGLLLEGVEAERIEVSQPGIDVDRFAVPAPEPPPDRHIILSPGRLVWEKGHQDVLRAAAALRRGMVEAPAEAVARMELLIVGSGPEEQRLKSYAAELGLADAVRWAHVPYDEMPSVYAEASAMVLASLSSATMAYHPWDVPRAFWEEQFGMVLAEAMAAGLPIVASTNGAIPEVVGPSGTYVAPGDWMGIARALAAGPLSRPPAARAAYPAELVQRYSTGAAAERLAAAYDRVLAGSSSRRA